MASESRFLHEVTEAFSSRPENERAWLTSIFSTGDRVVQLTTAMVPGATNICLAPRARQVELSRQYPGVIMIDGSVGHSGMPRSVQVREVIDARMAEVQAQRERPDRT